MKKRPNVWVVWTLFGTAFMLASCSEKPQSISQNSRQDQQAFHGPASAFTASGWKPGDKTSWEQQLKTRQQAGQNEYNKVN